MRAGFFYRGALYRERDGTIECMTKLAPSYWIWKPVNGFLARKIRRARTKEK